MRPVFCLFFTLLLVALSHRLAHADPSDVETVTQTQVRFAQGTTAEREQRFADALAAYEEVVANDPSGDLAYDARKRVERLRARSEGDFVPYATLTRIKSDPQLSSDAAAIDELVKTAEAWPAGLVRIEAWLFAASAYAERLQRPREAERLWRKVLDDRNVDHESIQTATRELVLLRLREGDHMGAERVAREAGPHLDEATRKLVARVRFRDQLHIASIATVAVPLLLATVGFLRAARSGRVANVLSATRRVLPLACVMAAYAAIAGAALALGYEAGTSKPFLIFGLALLPLILLARVWSAAGAQTKAARIGRAVVCAASAFGAGFLVLEQINVAFLEGMGL